MRGKDRIVGGRLQAVGRKITRESCSRPEHSYGLVVVTLDHARVLEAGSCPGHTDTLGIGLWARIHVAVMTVQIDEATHFVGGVTNYVNRYVCF